MADESLPPVDQDSWSRYQGAKLTEYAASKITPATPEPAPEPPAEPAGIPAATSLAEPAAPPPAAPAMGDQPPTASDVAPAAVPPAMDVSLPLTPPLPEPPVAGPPAPETTEAPPAPASPRETTLPSWVPPQVKTALDSHREQPLETQDPAKAAALAVGSKQIGKPYAGPIVGQSEAARWGSVGWDCSSFVAGVYKQLGVNLPAFTDAIAGQTELVKPGDERPGDIILYKYRDSYQPGVKYPHTGLLVGGGKMLDAAYGQGVGVHSMLNQPYEVRRPSGFDPADGKAVVDLGHAEAMPTGFTAAPGDGGGQSFLDSVGEKISGAASATGSAVSGGGQSFMDFVGDKVSSLIRATAPVTQEDVSYLGKKLSTVPDVTGFQPDVPVQDQDPSAARPGSVASRMPLRPGEAGPPTPDQRAMAEMINPDLHSLGGIHEFAGALGETAGGSIHAALPEGVRNVPVVEGLLKQGLNPEFAPGSAAGMLVGEAAGLGLKALSPALQAIAPTVDRALIERGVDLSVLGAATKENVLSHLLQQGVDAPTLTGLSDAAAGKLVGDAIETVKATAAQNGVSAGEVAANAGIGAGATIAADRKANPDAGIGETIGAGLLGAGLGAGAAVRGATVGLGVKAITPIATRSPELNAIVEAVNGGAVSKAPLSQQWRALGQRIEQSLADELAPANAAGSKEGEAAIANYRGGRAGAAQQIVEQEIAPIYDALGANQGKNEQLVNDFNAYVSLNTYLERAAQKGSNRLGPGGIKSEAEGRAALSELVADINARDPSDMVRIQKADDLRQTALTNLLDEKVRTGFITPELRDWLVKTYPHYNPVNVLLAIDETQGVVSGNKMSQIGNTLRRLSEEGSAADTMPALQSTLLAKVYGHSAVMRNDAIKTWLDFFKGQVQTPELLSAGARDKRYKPTALIPIRPAQELRTGVDIHNAPDLATIVTGRLPKSPNEIAYWKNGKRYIADLSVMPEVAKTLNNLNPESLSTFARVAQVMNAPMRMGATTLRVPFQVRNAMFDAIDAWTRSGITPWGENGVLWGYAQAAKNTPAYQAYVKEGGSMGGFVMSEPTITKVFKKPMGMDKAGAELERQVRAAGGISIETPADVLRLGKRFGIDAITLKPIRRVGEIIESGPRMARYGQGLAAGESPAIATMEGRRVTVDFARMGGAMRTINAVMPFTNAALQGQLNIARSVRDNPATVLTRLAALDTAVAGTYAWNRTMPERWADIPEHEKANALVILLPGGEVKNDTGPGYKVNPHIAIPLRALGALPYFITKGLEKMDGQDPDFGDALTRSLGTLSPVNDVSSVATGLLGGPGKEMMQQQAGPGGFDYFRGRPIVSESLGNYQPGEQATPQTTNTAKDMAYILNRSFAKNFAGEQSPVRLEHAISETTGGFGRDLLQGVDALGGKRADEGMGAAAANAVTGLYKTYGGQTEQNLYNQRDKKMSDLQGQYRDTYRALTLNGANIGQPPKEIEKIPLLPPEQADYREAQLQFLTTIFKENPHINETLATVDKNDPQSLDARASVLQLLEKEAAKYAAGTVLERMNPDDVAKRLENKQEADPRKLYPQKDYTPVGAR